MSAAPARSMLLMNRAAGSSYFVWSPSLARREAGVTAAVVVVPVVVSAFVDKTPTPFCVVVQSRLKNVTVLPLAVVPSPWNADP